MYARLLLLLLLTGPALAQDEYRASAIPADLHPNAHAVVRRHDTHFTVKAPGEALHRIRTVVTILDAQGDGQAQLTVWYDKLSRINDIWGAIYDAQGTLIKKLRKADIEDRSAFDGYSFLTDNRFKQASFPRQPTYPYTVEFVQEATERNLMFYPTWNPQSGFNVAVEQATLTIDTPKGQALRYKEVNQKKSVEKEDGPTATTYRWKLDHLPALTPEPMSPPVQELLPIVYTAPTVFEVQGYSGHIKSWADVGRFYYELNQHRDVIPEDLRQQVISLTRNETTQLGKIRKVYELVQQQTRYVSVQLGIGGWQTIEADKVAATRYGDCKALTNYTKALLKAAGIPSVEALVYAGDNRPDIQTDFPRFQFNHVILCVPNNRDTLFLECTDQTGSLGYNGTFTGNRHVLLITPDGGRLTKTPSYGPTDNQQIRRVDVRLTEQGDATAEAVNLYTGLLQESRSRLIHDKTPTEQRAWILEHTNIPHFELNRFTLAEEKGRIPRLTETLSLSIRKWATLSGSRLFVPLNLLSAQGLAQPLTAPRQRPLVLNANWDWQYVDTVAYHLPQGYTPEFMPPPVTFSTVFGDYHLQTTLSGSQLIYVRRITMRRGTHPAAAYADWVDFRKKVSRYDRIQLVLVKKEIATK